MEISCENCQCSRCDFWRSCNDSIYHIEDWCEVCNDLDIERCHTTDCASIRSENEYRTHPLQIVKRGE